MKHLLDIAVDVVCWVLVAAIAVWWGYRCYERSQNRPLLVGKWIISAFLVVAIVALFRLAERAPVMGLLVIAPSVVLAFIWLPSVGSILLRPLTESFTGSEEEAEPKPFYYLAEGKRRKGLYQEAIDEVKKQLELFPGDFEGYTKLATIQMENLKDFPAAQATLNEFLALPKRTPNEIVSSLHLLADWQLQFAHDAQGAAESLRRIIELCPGTPSAHAAEQRIAHLGQADEAMRARHEQKFVVKQRERNIGLRQPGADAPVAAPPDAHERASEFVKHLEQHPTDTEAREKLAVLYAEEFQRLDLAADQLEQLIALPMESAKHVAHWLELLATLHIRHGHDLPAAEAALHRIIERFPGGALATVATSRLATLQAEMKAGQKTAAKTLGSYEKNVGLKLLDG